MLKILKKCIESAKFLGQIGSQETRISLEELAATIPHGQIGVTVVGEIRKMGGDVIRTSGRSLYHATLTGLTPEQISSLLTPTIPNPAQQ